MKTSRFPSSLPILLFALLLSGASLFVLSGCDAIAGVAGIDEVDVDLGAAGENIPVSSGDPTFKTANVSRGGEDLPDVFDVESITISEDNVSYEPSGIFKSDNIDSGTLDVFLIIERAPAIGVEITIEDDVVTNIDPETIEVGNYGDQEFDDCLESLGDDRPPLRNDYESLSDEAIQEIVSDAILQESFQVSIMVCSSGSINGTLAIDDVTINLDF